MEHEPFEWDDRYSVGFKLIDEQHKRLFSIYNKIIESKRSQTPQLPEVIAEVLADLNEYVGVHFLCEEEVMKAYGYPGLPEHKKEHERFAKTIRELSLDYQNGSVLLMDSMIKRIKSWLTHHILCEDHKYKSLFTQSEDSRS